MFQVTTELSLTSSTINICSAKLLGMLFSRRLLMFKQLVASRICVRASSNDVNALE
jgi:hypothetical protein